MAGRLRLRVVQEFRARHVRVGSELTKEKIALLSAIGALIPDKYNWLPFRGFLKGSIKDL